MKGLKDILLSGERKGCEAVEIYLEEGEVETIEVRGGSIENYDRAKDLGYGIRVLKDGAMGLAYGTNLFEAETILEQALALTSAGEPDSHITFSKDFRIDNPLVKEELATTKGKIEALIELEKEIISSDSRIISVGVTHSKSSRNKVTLLNNQGVEVTFNKGVAYVFADITTSDGKDQRGAWDVDVKRTFEELDLKKIQEGVVKKGISLLGAKKIPSQKITVILPPMEAAELLDALTSVFTAEAIQKKKSVYREQLGEKIAPDFFSLIEDAKHIEALNPLSVDEEGVPTVKTEIIKDGVLNSFLYNLYTASKDDRTSTGNGVRGSYRTIPRVAPLNLYVKPGTRNDGEVIKGVEKGIYVFSLMGAHLINPISGNFSIGANGLLIEKGELTSPVAEITLVGNIKDLLLNVGEVSSELAFMGTVSSPLIRIDEVMVSSQ